MWLLVWLLIGAVIGHVFYYVTPLKEIDDSDLEITRQAWRSGLFVERLFLALLLGILCLGCCLFWPILVGFGLWERRRRLTPPA